MPVELWLECDCSSTKPGEELVVVGSHPLLGDWDPERGVALVTDASSFPHWAFPQPLLLSGDSLAHTIEYKYVVRKEQNPGNVRWENFGESEDLPKFSGSVLSDHEILSGCVSTLKPVNRKLSLSPRRDNLLIRFDSFGALSFSGASWIVSPTWAPQLLGGDYKIVDRSLRTTKDMQDKVISPRLALARACKANFGYVSNKMLKELDSLDLLAVEIFAKPQRGALITVLHQLRQVSQMHVDIWRLIAEFVPKQISSVKRC
eukprot:gnl/MRDRNA2_/MRDRNA2_111550_c0_seq1.p1 gnl/MRDRNA2_/MRDRNA2_111550_c0~~gnl/MRDRNA2_/MRDRNA2_111550_c0_seq1.p1  ORF type:complete len:260 (+),score=44.54 gnl/MRDRNA2_/MRDRNA2_111550_c0_seq1:89-868(+)